MSISKISSSCNLLKTLFLLLLFKTVVGADPIFHFCSSTDNSTASCPSDSNLNKLTSYLSYQAPPTGFASGSIGQKPDQTYGLALCRGDVSSSDCKTCIVQASSEIRQLCPYYKGAIIWYDYCLLKYSETDFFGQIDNKNKFYLWNVKVVSDPVQFNEKTKELLTQLAKKAYVTPKLYATGQLELEYGSEQLLYGLVQCSRDLSNEVCRKCLDGIIGEIPSCCDGKEGGRVVSGSCNFRYEIYPFVNA